MNAVNQTPIIAPPAELPDWAQQSVNLANDRLGACVLYASDEFFAPASRLLNPEPAQFIPNRYDANGKWMDGWESRRKRVAGHDWCLVKLAGKGRVRGFDVDTSHFIGNYPMTVSIDATLSGSDDVAALQAAYWRQILPVTLLGPNSHHLLKTLSEFECSHLRVNIHPDGGLARLRVYGDILPQFEPLPSAPLIDLAALRNGGRAVAWNDASFGSAVTNLLLPDRALHMGDGWETRRRREPGNDWCIIQLGAPGSIEKIEVDTAFFKGNYPDRCSIQASFSLDSQPRLLTAQSQFWPVLLAEQALTMDAIHTFSDAISPLGLVTHVRVNIFPDGGLSRLRLWGKLAQPEKKHD